MLRRRREELGLSLEDVAARINMSAHAYGSWERTPAQEWSDEKLHALVAALEMSEPQGCWLFRLALGREPARAPWNQPLRPSGPVPPSGPRTPVPASPPTPTGPARPSGPVPPSGPVRPPADPGTQAYLRDYATMMDAVPLPSLLFDRSWDIVHTNSAFDALFQGVGPHPTAMPDQNFLRFVLFHPDAATVLGEHETSWCLPMMAQLESALESNEDDRVLQAIRRDIAQDPIMDAAYRCGLPLWMSAVGAAAVHHDGSVRPLNHPDPRWGRTDCRIVDETPRTLQDKGFTRMTLVPRETRTAAKPGRRRGTHLRAVSG